MDNEKVVCLCFDKGNCSAFRILYNIISFGYMVESIDVDSDGETLSFILKEVVEN